MKLRLIITVGDWFLWYLWSSLPEAAPRSMSTNDSDVAQVWFSAFALGREPLLRSTFQFHVCADKPYDGFRSPFASISPIQNAISKRTMNSWCFQLNLITISHIYEFLTARWWVISWIRCWNMWIRIISWPNFNGFSKFLRMWAAIWNQVQQNRFKEFLSSSSHWQTDMNMIEMSLYPIVDTATADRLLAMHAIHFVATISWMHWNSHKRKPIIEFISQFDVHSSRSLTSFRTSMTWNCLTCKHIKLFCFWWKLLQAKITSQPRQAVHKRSSGCSCVYRWHFWFCRYFFQILQLIWSNTCKQKLFYFGKEQLELAAFMRNPIKLDTFWGVLLLDVSTPQMFANNCLPHSTVPHDWWYDTASESLAVFSSLKIPIRRHALIFDSTELINVKRTAAFDVAYRCEFRQCETLWLSRVFCQSSECFITSNSSCTKTYFHNLLLCSNFEVNHFLTSKIRI